MPLINKKKPGLLSRMLNKAEPQPSSLPSMGTKTLGEDGEVVAEPATASTGRGIFASRRSGRSTEPKLEAHVVEVVETSGDMPAPASDSSARDALAGLGLQKRGAAADDELAVEAGVDLSADESNSPSGEPSTPATNQPKSKGLFGLKKAAKAESPAPKAKLSKEKKPKAEKAAKAEKPAKAPKAQKSSGPVTSINLLTELGENGRQLLWSMTATTLVQLPDPPADVVSFSREDTRFHTELALPYAKAQAHAIEEIGEMVAVVNRTKELRTIYSTREERATSSPYKIGAGQQLLDLLLKKNGREGQALVTGFSLKDASGSTSVVVLYAMSEDGGSSKPQVTVNPDNMTFVLAQFTTSRKIPRDTPQVLFTNEDLLAVAGEMKYFPKERTWNGIPIRVLQNFGAGITGVVAAGAVGWASMGYMSKQSLSNRTAEVKKRTDAVTEKNNQLIGSGLTSFAANLTEDHVRMFSISQQMWVPNSKVTAEMKSGELKVTVALPLQLGKIYANGPSVFDVTGAANLRQLYEKVAPDGCSKSQPQTTGNLNEIRIDITCQSPDTSFYRYRGD
jgi:hypothetical protein